MYCLSVKLWHPKERPILELVNLVNNPHSKLLNAAQHFSDCSDSPAIHASVPIVLFSPCYLPYADKSGIAWA